MWRDHPFSKITGQQKEQWGWWVGGDREDGGGGGKLNKI